MKKIVDFKGHKLPEGLVNGLINNEACSALSARKYWLRKIKNLNTSPGVIFYGMEHLERENRSWNSEDSALYLGSKTPLAHPGDMDPDNSVIIGEVEPDSPIVLDYCTEPPRVCYFGDLDHETYWFELSASYQDLFDELIEASLEPMVGVSPFISKCLWGKVEVEGYGEFKDVIVSPKGARDWDWSLTGTRHVPGIQPADVHELLEDECTHVVLSKGMHQKLQVCDTTLEFLAASNLYVQIEETSKAVRLYNKLALEGKAVGALIHSTC